MILADFDPNNLMGSMVVETVQFVGGLDQVVGGFEVRLADLLAPTLGTGGNDVLNGTSGVDVIQGAQGMIRLQAAGATMC